jgi:hypothetical protein
MARFYTAPQHNANTGQFDVQQVVQCFYLDAASVTGLNQRHL